MDNKSIEDLMKEYSLKYFKQVTSLRREGLSLVEIVDIHTLSRRYDSGEIGGAKDGGK